MHEQTCLSLFCSKLMDVLVIAASIDNVSLSSTDPQGHDFTQHSFIFHLCWGLHGELKPEVIGIWGCSLLLCPRFLHVNQLSYHSTAPDRKSLNSRQTTSKHGFYQSAKSAQYASVSQSTIVRQRCVSVGRNSAEVLWWIWIFLFFFFLHLKYNTF